MLSCPLLLLLRSTYCIVHSRGSNVYSYCFIFCLYLHEFLLFALPWNVFNMCINVFHQIWKILNYHLYGNYLCFFITGSREPPYLILSEIIKISLCSFVDNFASCIFLSVQSIISLIRNHTLNLSVF